MKCAQGLVNRGPREGGLEGESLRPSKPVKVDLYNRANQSREYAPAAGMSRERSEP